MENSAMTAPSGENKPGYKLLFSVLCILLFLTALTVTVSRIDLGILNVWIAILIAAVKATCVLLFFMHLKYESRLLQLTFGGTILCLALLISFLFWDIAFR